MRIDQWAEHLSHLGRTGAIDPAPLPPDPSLRAGARGEQRLWRAAGGENVDVSDLLNEGDLIEREGCSASPIPIEGAPILPTDGYLAIEVWTECELSAMHALRRLTRLGHPAARAHGRARLDAAIRWHLANTQPDNATNRPWAIHVFLEASGGLPRPGIDTAEASLYAETLLSNMLASDARSEELSRWILADASRELRMGAALG